MAEKPTAIRAVQVGAIYMAAAASGAAASTSLLFVPRLLESPAALMVRQWRRNFDIARKVFPTTCGFAALGFFCLSSSTLVSGAAAKTGLLSPSRLYLVAGLLCAGVMPYTLVVLGPSNAALMSVVDKADMDEGALGFRRREDEEAARTVLRRWARLNLGRAAIIAGGAVLGLWASL